jgi:hypothetical protein
MKSTRAPDTPPDDNPIADFARALREAPPIAEAPFALLPTTAKTPRTAQRPLFDAPGKDDTP